MKLDKIKWIVQIVLDLMEQGFSGTLMLDFHKGDISRKYRKQVTEYADEITH